MTSVIDYGVGNLFSLVSGFARIGEKCEVTSDPDVIKASDRIILPGVGAFGDAAEKLRASGLGEVLRGQAENGKPVMGICLGMQLLFDMSYEFGEHAGLGLIPGRVLPLRGYIPPSLKVPHMGWNRLYEGEAQSALFDGLDRPYMYFVHSFYVSCPAEYISALTEYGMPVTASVKKRNVYGCQFHPEKSGDDGLRILENFCSLKG